MANAYNVNTKEFRVDIRSITKLKKVDGWYVDVTEVAGIDPKYWKLGTEAAHVENTGPTVTVPISKTDQFGNYLAARVRDTNDDLVKNPDGSQKYDPAFVPDTEVRANPFDDVFTATFVSMTDAEKDAAIEAEMDINVVKAEAIHNIDIVVGEVLKRGFEYPASSGNFYSAGTDSQRNYTWLIATKDNARTTYPVPYFTVDTSYVLQMADASELEDFCFAGADYIRDAKVDAITPKTAVMAATTVKDVWAVVDDYRTAKGVA